jgi:gamma-glutamylcyclotransferase (GGCT)/AIG2-like uncharacterized protein YtfP
MSNTVTINLDRESIEGYMYDVLGYDQEAILDYRTTASTDMLLHLVQSALDEEPDDTWPNGQRLTAEEEIGIYKEANRQTDIRDLMAERNSGDKLFVYGIFLDEYNRKAYGMSNPAYDTVLDYATFGNGIVQAVRITRPEGKPRLSLTGLVVDVDPAFWPDIDRLEQAYDRIEVETTSKQKAYMYVRPKR